jgi:hypothetical protein
MIVELTTSLLMLASAFTSVNGGISSDIATATPAVSTATASQTISKDHPLSTVSTEAYVRDYFRDIPLLAEVSRCESTFRQFGSDGRVIRGKVNTGDIGIMQINKYYHEDDAAKLGFDIYTIDDNLGYARWLYQKYGTDPWSSSSKCWKQTQKLSTEIARN